MGDTRLGDPALDGIGQKFFMPVAAGAAVIGNRDQLAVFIVRIGIDAGKRPDTAGGGPCTGTFAVRHSNTFAALDERGDLLAGDDKRWQRFQNLSPGRTFRTKLTLVYEGFRKRPVPDGK